MSFSEQQTRTVQTGDTGRIIGRRRESMELDTSKAIITLNARQIRPVFPRRRHAGGQA